VLFIQGVTFIDKMLCNINYSENGYKLIKYSMYHIHFNFRQEIISKRRLQQIAATAPPSF